MKFLETGDTLITFSGNGEVDGVWCNNWPNYMLPVSKTRLNGPGGFYLVLNITAYLWIWPVFLDGVIYDEVCCRVVYLHGRVWLLVSNYIEDESVF